MERTVRTVIMVLIRKKRGRRFRVRSILVTSGSSAGVTGDRWRREAGVDGSLPPVN